MFLVVLVEGKDSPVAIPVEFKEKGRTAGLLLWMLRMYFYKGWYVVLDYGFCVLKALIELQKVGVYSVALIKKRKCWPAGVHGDVMQQFPVSVS
jgi:hypothetical protein